MTPEGKQDLLIGLGARGAVVGAALLLYGVHRLPTFVGPLVVVLGPLLDAAVHRFRKGSPAIEPPKPEAPELKPPDVGESFRVSLSIRDTFGRTTGRDNGWLIFSEGWILFEGVRTEFAITRGESYRWPTAAAFGLRLEDGRNVVISVAPNAGLEKRLNQAFRAWEAAPIPDGEAMLPPREVHTEIYARRHGFWILGGAFAGAGIASGAWDGSRPEIALATIALTGSLVGMSHSARQLRTALARTPLSARGSTLAESIMPVNR